MSELQPINNFETTNNSLTNITLIVYILQAIGLFTIVGFIVAIIINYIKLNDVQNTWLQSHFRWQIRPFWFGSLWMLIGGILSLIVIGHAILFITYIWVIYRIVKGWLNLNDNRPII